MRGPWHQFAVAAGVVGLGVLVLVLTPFIEGDAGYAGVSPRFVPYAVGAALVGLGGALSFDVARHGFMGVDEAAEGKLPMDWAAFGWISGSLVAAGLLVESAGFVIACTILFAMAARGFRSRRLAMDLGIGFVLSAAIFAAFNYGLGLSLPVGILPLPA